MPWRNNKLVLAFKWSRQRVRFCGDMVSHFTQLSAKPMNARHTSPMKASPLCQPLRNISSLSLERVRPMSNYFGGNFQANFHWNLIIEPLRISGLDGTFKWSACSTPSSSPAKALSIFSANRSEEKGVHCLFKGAAHIFSCTQFNK